jgi:hypothetical protein
MHSVNEYIHMHLVFSVLASRLIFFPKSNGAYVFLYDI